MKDSYRLMEYPYFCTKCEEISELDDFEDTENDGDTWGICPKCKTYSMIWDWYEYKDDSKEQKQYELKE